MEEIPDTHMKQVWSPLSEVQQGGLQLENAEVQMPLGSGDSGHPGAESVQFYVFCNHRDFSGIFVPVPCPATPTSMASMS